MEKTTKIDNDHADEQIEVEGSSISSNSNENEKADQEEFRRACFIQKNANSHPGRTPTTMTTIHGRPPSREPINPHNTPISQSTQNSKNSSSPYRGIVFPTKIHAIPSGTGHQVERLRPRIHPSHWRSGRFPEDAAA